MADITLSKAKRDDLATLTENNGAASQTIPWDGIADERAYLLVRNTDATTDAVVTIKAGTGQRSAIGDLAVTVAKSAAAVIGPLDSMRFVDRATKKVTVTLSGPATLAGVKLALVYA